MRFLKSTIPRRLISTQNAPKQSVISVVEQTESEKNVEWANAEPYAHVPGPKPVPLFGNTWRFIPFIGDFQIEHIDKVSRQLYKEYGKVVKMGGLLGRPDMLFLFDPDEIEKVFRQEDAMPLRPSMPSLNYYKHVYRKEFFGESAGVIAVHGENWQNFRSRVNQIMLQPRITKMYVKSIARTAQDFVKRIEQIKSKVDHEVPEDFLNEIHKWSLESIAKIALDVDLGCLEPDAPPDTQRLIDAVNTFFINVPVLELKIPFWRVWPTPTFKAYIESLDTIREICSKHIECAINAKCETKEELSVLQRVLQMDHDAKIASNLALDLFLVGIDTTSNAVASILYQLALHQPKQKILHEEIEQVLGDGDTQLNYEKLDRMAYLKACIKETMRLYPVVIGNGRCLTSDRVIAGYQVPKGVQVIFQHYVISNLEQYFPQAHQFQPERWLKGCPEHKNHHPFASLPFGFGKRMCLGRRFAELEIQTVIAEIFRKYHVFYEHERLDYHIHPMYTPNGPLKLKFLERDIKT